MRTAYSSKTLIETKDILVIDQLQKQIYQDYIDDIARFARPDIKLKAEKCYKSIPFQLAKDNHKFQYSMVEKNGSARKYEKSIDWLENAHFVYPVYAVNKLEFPLESYVDETNFRLYPVDIGC